jgi:hypothetical protein
MTFEHTTTFLPVEYVAVHHGKWIFKHESPLPVSPDIHSLFNSDTYSEQLLQMGHDGWELVSVQSLLRGVHHSPGGSEAGGSGISYSLTAGYYCFWKRVL